MGHPAIRDIISQQLPWLSCPSDPSAQPSDRLWYWRVFTATTSYKGVIGDSEITSDGGGPAKDSPFTDLGSDDCHNTAECNGLIWRATYFYPVSLRKVTDGTSKTFMVGESVVAQDYHSAAFFSDGDWATCGNPLNYFIIPEEETEIKKAPNWQAARGFKSLHPGGAQFVMADGSVILPLDDLSNAACEAVANNIKGTLALPHAYGRLQFGADLDLHFRTLIGTGANPNVAAVVVIGIDGATWNVAGPLLRNHRAYMRSCRGSPAFLQESRTRSRPSQSLASVSMYDLSAATREAPGSKASLPSACSRLRA